MSEYLCVFYRTLFAATYLMHTMCPLFHSPIVATTADTGSAAADTITRLPDAATRGRQMDCFVAKLWKERPKQMDDLMLEVDDYSSQAGRDLGKENKKLIWK